MALEDVNVEQAHKEYIEWFRQKGAEYWLFSKANDVAFSRARGDVPVEVVDGLDEATAQDICARIRKKFERGQYNRLYVDVLVRLNDVSAIDVLKTVKIQLKGRPEQKWWREDIARVEKAIAHLKSVDKRDALASTAPSRWQRFLTHFKTK